VGQANGTFSPALAQLPALDYLFMSSHRIFGDLPEEIFRMPTLRFLGLKKIPINVRIPSNVSQSLRYMCVRILNPIGIPASGERPNRLMCDPPFSHFFFSFAVN
jgi:hypothetical protein